MKLTSFEFHNQLCYVRFVLILKLFSCTYQFKITLFLFTVSAQLCDDVAAQLIKAASNIALLHRRLSAADYEGSASEPESFMQKTDMLVHLKLSIGTTLKLLQDVSLDNLPANGVDNFQRDTVKRLNELVMEVSHSDQNSVVSMMHKFSDILLGMMQQKICNSENSSTFAN